MTEAPVLALAHPANATFGWVLMLMAFLSGALIGLGFHKDQFLGGYDSLRRRMLRLGHIAFAALGMLNILFGLSPHVGPPDRLAASALIIGGAAMPLVCFLTAWRTSMRHLFVVPVLSLITAVVAILIGGLS